MALSPSGHTLISVDEDGHALLINFLKRVVLADFHFKKPVRPSAFSIGLTCSVQIADIKFSPDGQ